MTGTEAATAPMMEVRIADPRWTDALGDVEALIGKVLSHAFRSMDDTGLVDILLTGDEEMRALNLRWRGFDKPTDVLSFPDGSPGEPGQPDRLGDIAIAYETSLRDSEAMRRPFEAHVSHLLVHGFLHLFGYDHIDPAEADEMEALEAEILAGLGVPDPYQEGSCRDESGGHPETDGRD